MAHNRNEFSRFALLVIEINGDSRVCDLTHREVARVDVLNQATAHGVILDPHGEIQMRTVHLAVLCKNIPDTAGDLASHRDSAMAVLHPATLNDDVLRR